MIICSSCAASASSHHRCSRCATTILGSVMHPLSDRCLDGDKLGFLPASSFVSVAPNLGRRGPSPRSAVSNQDTSPEYSGSLTRRWPGGAIWASASSKEGPAGRLVSRSLQDPVPQRRDADAAIQKNRRTRG